MIAKVRRGLLVAVLGVGALLLGALPLEARAHADPEETVETFAWSHSCPGGQGPICCCAGPCALPGAGKPPVVCAAPWVRALTLPCAVAEFADPARAPSARRAYLPPSRAPPPQS